MKIEQLYTLFKQSYCVSTDTRRITKGSLFFALKGENFDANTFAEQALIKGADYVVVDNPEYFDTTNKHYILVKNSLETLQKLAQFHRKQLGIPIIALTGSNGKTTTKELLNAVLQTTYKTTATKGNLNNHIGVPLTLLSMTPKTEIGIVEMGANHFEEIAFLCQIAAPNFGYITNFGKAHLEGFGSLEGVVKAKSELYTYLANHNGVAFINHKNTQQVQITKSQKRLRISEDKTLVSFNPFVVIDYNGVQIESNLIGKYNYDNIVAAVGIGVHFKVSIVDLVAAIHNYVPNNKRSQLLQIGRTKVILDAYNANPTSMQAAISNFKEQKDKKKILILGDMFELGESAQQEHQQIADFTRGVFSSVFLIGENFYGVQATHAIKYRDFKSFETSFTRADYYNASLLIKGSRGMALERVLELLEIKTQKI